MRFSEHLGELKARLKVVFYTFVVVLLIIVVFPSDPAKQAQHLDQYTTLQFLANTVIATFLQHIQGYILPSGWELIAAKGLGEGMEVYFIAALLISVAICMPVIAYEVYKFIDPALKPEEKQLVYPFVTATSLLFVIGIVFGYFVLAKFLVLALAPFLQATGTTFLIDSASFYYVIFLIVGSTGAAFTAPVFVYAIIRLHVIEAAFFSRNRVVIWFAIWIITGLFLTPDGGPLLDLVIFIPIVTMVEIAVWLGGRAVGKTKQRSQPAPANTCKHCGAALSRGREFCPNCQKSQH